MKFRYDYRSSDNKRHSSVISARNKDAVYSLLAKKGIRPCLVEALPNPFRIVFWGLGVLAFFVLVIWVYYVYASSQIAKPLVRKQLQGNAVLIERGVESDWRDVLDDPIDRYLARYAQPGWRIRVKLNDDEYKIVVSGLKNDANKKVRFSKSDLDEFRQLKMMIAGIRNEAYLFIDEGGDVEQYMALLDTRQEMEISYYTEIARRFSEKEKYMSNDRLYFEWMECNRLLSSRGLKTLLMPEKLILEKVQ